MEAIDHMKQRSLAAILSTTLMKGEINTLSEAELRLYNQMLESMTIAARRIVSLQVQAKERFATR